MKTCIEVAVKTCQKYQLLLGNISLLDFASCNLITPIYRLEIKLQNVREIFQVETSAVRISDYDTLILALETRVQAPAVQH